MDQMTLFPLDAKSAETNASESVPIRSGCVGPVRFGATETSFAMTRSVLDALAAPPGHADEAPQR